MHDLTTGSVTRHLLKTTSFMLVTMVFQTLYFLADLYWVGRLGSEAVAAVAIAGNLAFGVLAGTQLLSVGTTTLVSHAAGQKNQPQANIVFNQSMVVAFAFAISFFVSATLFRSWYATALAADGSTAALTDSYLTWFIPAMALQFPMVSMSAALRGTGNFKPGMIVQTSTVIVNILLTPVLIFGWLFTGPLGVGGAAIATLISVAIGTGWLATYFRSSQAYLHIRPAEWFPRPRLWGAMLKIGTPAGAEFALTAVYMLVVYVVIRPFGSAAQAGFGIGLRLVQSCFLPVVALGVAVAPVAGQNFGAGRGERVRETFRSAAAMAGVIMLLAALLCGLVPGRLIAFFSANPDVIAFGSEYLRIVALSFVASGVVFVASSMFQAMGNTLPPLFASFGRIVAVTVPVILLSRLEGFQPAWIWYLSVAAIWLQLGANLALLRREYRRRLKFG